MTESSEVFKISLTGPGLTYDANIDEIKAAKIFQICFSKDKVITDLTEGGINEEKSSSTRLSLVEYLDQFDPKRNPDKILCFGSYVTDILGRDNFTPEMLKPYFQKCGEPVPKNYGRDFRWALTNGWICEALDEPGHFYITKSGKAALTSNFSDDILKKTRTRKQKKVKSGNSTGISDES